LAGQRARADDCVERYVVLNRQLAISGKEFVVDYLRANSAEKARSRLVKNRSSHLSEQYGSSFRLEKAGSSPSVLETVQQQQNPHAMAPRHQPAPPCGKKLQEDQ
jgi:hypothetical protein